MRERRALIADDHELFGWALQSILKGDLKFSHVSTVSSCQEAMLVIGSGMKLDLICIDLIMPGMLGFESIRALRKEANSETSIVVVSASTRRDDVVEAIRSGVQGYIPKTLRTPEITEALRRVLDGHIFIPSAIMRTVPLPHPERRLGVAETVIPVGSSTDRNATFVRNWSCLSERQRAVAEFIVQGKSNKQIAIELGLAEGTVKVHVAALFRILSVKNRVEAVNALNRME